MFKEKPPVTPPKIMRKSDVPIPENSCIFCQYKEDILMPELVFGRNLISGIGKWLLAET